jgi:hypothetical protein
MQLQTVKEEKFSLIDEFVVQNFRSRTNHQLIKGNKTRWNSTFNMMKRFLELNSIIEELVRKKNKTHSKYLFDEDEKS